MGGTWAYLDITALGRQEEWEDSPDGYPQEPPYTWWRRHKRVRADRRGAAATKRSMEEQIERATNLVIPFAHLGGMPLEEMLPAFGAPASRW